MNENDAPGSIGLARLPVGRFSPATTGLSPLCQLGRLGQLSQWPVF
jgi:hypothetical protein